MKSGNAGAYHSSTRGLMDATTAQSHKCPFVREQSFLISRASTALAMGLIGTSVGVASKKRKVEKVSNDSLRCCDDSPIASRRCRLLGPKESLALLRARASGLPESARRRSAVPMPFKSPIYQRSPSVGAVGDAAGKPKLHHSRAAARVRQRQPRLLAPVGHPKFC